MEAQKLNDHSVKMDMDQFNKNNPKTRMIPGHIDPVPMPAWYECPNGTFVKATPVLHSMRIKHGLRAWTGEGLPPGIAEQQELAKAAMESKKLQIAESNDVDREALKAEVLAEMTPEIQQHIQAGIAAGIKAAEKKAKK